MNHEKPYLILDENIPGCIHFKWYEVLTLNEWKFAAYPTHDIAEELQKIAIKLDWIRQYFSRPIRVTSAYRPLVYNQFIGGSLRSAHIQGKAIDFKVQGIKADKVRHELIPFLDRLNIRMEDLPGSNWVHIDNRPVGKSRYFKP